MVLYVWRYVSDFFCDVSGGPKNRYRPRAEVFFDKIGICRQSIMKRKLQKERESKNLKKGFSQKCRKHPKTYLFFENIQFGKIVLSSFNFEEVRIFSKKIFCDFSF